MARALQGTWVKVPDRALVKDALARTGCLAKEKLEVLQPKHSERSSTKYAREMAVLWQYIASTPKQARTGRGVRLMFGVSLRKVFADVAVEGIAKCSRGQLAPFGLGADVQASALSV